MNASKNNDGVLLAAASATLAGVVLSQPLISLGGASLAALVGLRLRVTPSLASTAVSARFPRARGRDDLAEPLMLRGFGGRDGSSPASTSDSTKSADEAGSSSKTPGKGERGSASYREFAAGLEEDDQEISFLPPYASDNAEKSARSEKGDEVSESLLIRDLQEAVEPVGKIPVARRFALGTVAIIRRLLEPQDVERILIEQRRYPRLRFGDVAVQLNLLSDSEVQELLVAQEQGIFSDEEITDARQRLSSYHTGGPA